MKKDKELFTFPILGMIFSLIFIVALLFPAVFVYAITGPAQGIVFYLILFLLYFGLAIIATFFNVCTVYTVKTRFEGKNATFGESIRFAFSRFHLIVSWAFVSAIVGLIMRILENIAEKMGFVGELIMKILISIMGAAWSIITVFVIPGMVYNNVGPIDAIKKSIDTMKKTWGESLIRYVGFGIAEFLLILIGIVLTIVGAVVSVMYLQNYTLRWIAIGLGALYVLGVIIFFSVANAIFNTALFVYADTGKVPEGFDKEVLANTFGKKK
jgi:hypothetical protein